MWAGMRTDEPLTLSNAMKTDPVSPALPKPAAETLTWPIALLNGLVMIAGLALGISQIVDGRAEVGAGIIAGALLQTALVSLAIQTREEAHAVRQEQAWLIQQADEARASLQHQTACLDWLVQQQADAAARNGGAASRPQRIALPQS